MGEKNQWALAMTVTGDTHLQVKLWLAFVQLDSHQL